MNQVIPEGTAATQAPAVDTQETALPAPADGPVTPPSVADAASSEPVGEPAVSAPGPVTEDTALLPTLPGLRVRFNHETRDLTAVEAARYAQQGLKWESFQEDYNRLRFLAAGAGVSVSGLIADWLRQDEERELAQASAHCTDDDTARQLVALRREQRMRQWGAEAKEEPAERQAGQADCHSRLTADYRAVSAAFPGLPPAEQLPARVRQTAECCGISLFDAYLRDEYESRYRAEEARRTAEKAAAASTGSLGGAVQDGGREGRDFAAAFSRMLQ